MMSAMKRALAGLLLASAVPVRAQVAVGVPRVTAAPVPMSAAAVPTLAAPSLAAPALAPSLAAPSLTAAPLLSAAAAAAPALSAPPAALAPVVGPAAAPALSAALPAAASNPRETGERVALDASRMFDGFGTPRSGDFAAAATPEGLDAAVPLPHGWAAGSFQSADGGISVAYKRRLGPAGASPRVYAGGLALNESFDPLFARANPPAHSEYFMWTRGHAPTGWVPTKHPIDADARDLAHMIVLAARESKAAKVELALHSFGTLVFQRMLQLRDEPEVREALKLLSGSRVTLLNATTHYTGSERRAGREFEQMGVATRNFVDWLDMMDEIADGWHRNAERNTAAGAAMRDSLAHWREDAAKMAELSVSLNPFAAAAVKMWMQQWNSAAAMADKAADPNTYAGPSVEMLLASWREQRAQMLALASKGAANMMRADLAAPWPAEFDAIRQGFVAALARDSHDPAWQEALLRRSADMFRLEFSRKDVDVLRRMKTRVDLVHADGDQLLNWQSALALYELLGIRAPANAPKAGTELSDDTGRFRAAIVSGDHYYPQKKRDDLARRLDP